MATTKTPRKDISQTPHDVEHHADKSRKTVKPSLYKKKITEVEPDMTIQTDSVDLKQVEITNKVPDSLKTEGSVLTATVATAAVPGGKWEEVRKILLDMKAETLQEIKRSIKKGSEISVGEETTGDIYDQASSERDRELGLILNDRVRDKLHNIDEALLRINEGDYGLCEECDEEIPLGRLKVLPFTRHCVKCKSDLEKFQAQTRRIEEDRVYREIPGIEEDE